MFPETAIALEVEDRARVVHHGGDLRPAADHARVGRECVDLTVSHARDALDLETTEGGLDRRPLRVDDPPADPRLEDALAQLLEVVVNALRFDARRRFHDVMTLRVFARSLLLASGANGPLWRYERRGRVARSSFPSRPCPGSATTPRSCSSASRYARSAICFGICREPTPTSRSSRRSEACARSRSRPSKRFSAASRNDGPPAGSS